MDYLRYNRTEGVTSHGQVPSEQFFSRNIAHIRN